jgi:hypothetical protein
MNNLDYLNLNSLRNYPIKDGCSRVSNDGLFTIPNTLIVDIALCAPGNDTLSLYISRITCSSSNLMIEIFADTVGVFGKFNITLPSTDYNTDYVMQAGEAFPSATGMITIGTTEDLSGLPFGDFIFSSTSTPLLMKVYSPTNTGLSWINFTDNKGNTNTVTGYVKMQGNSNIQFRNVSDVIYMDAGENIGLNKTCTTPPNPILTINGIAPDSNGNFTLIPDLCVTIEPAQYGLVITDSCGKPCVGCTEISTLTDHLNSLESSVLEIKNFTENLQAAINQATTLINYQCQC